MCPNTLGCNTAISAPVAISLRCFINARAPAPRKPSVSHPPVTHNSPSNPLTSVTRFSNFLIRADEVLRGAG
jgi:hypothetical protein